MVDFLGYRTQIMVCCGSRCLLNESKKIREAFEKQLKAYNLDKEVFVFYNGCFGLCRQGPAVEIIDNVHGKVIYTHLKVEDVGRIVKEHIINHSVLQDLLPVLQ